MKYRPRLNLAYGMAFIPFTIYIGKQSKGPQSGQNPIVLGAGYKYLSTILKTHPSLTFLRFLMSPSFCSYLLLSSVNFLMSVGTPCTGHLQDQALKLYCMAYVFNIPQNINVIYVSECVSIVSVVSNLYF